MARQRTPNEKAKVLGLDVKDPQRYRIRANPMTAPLGVPPKWLSKEATTKWKTLAAEIPWLRKSDRQMVAITASLGASLQADPLKNISALSEYRRQLCALGGSPADRSKIFMPDENDENDPAREFIQ